MQQESQWYVWLEGVVSGPYNLNQMQRLIETQGLAGAARVRFSVTGDWRALQSFPELSQFLFQERASLASASKPSSEGAVETVKQSSAGPSLGSRPGRPTEPRPNALDPFESVETDMSLLEPPPIQDAGSVLESNPGVLIPLQRKKNWRRYRKYAIAALWTFVPMLILGIILSFFWKDPFRALQRKALSGDYEAQLELGTLFRQGGELKSGLTRQTVAVDLQAAFDYNLMAARTQKGEPLYRVAVMYADGIGTRPNPGKALEYFEGAISDKQLPDYSARLEEFALRCLEGRGLPQDEERAQKVFDILFDQWPASRQWRYACQLADGVFGSGDEQRAKACFELVAANSKNLSRYAESYAIRLAQGKGVPGSESEALVLLNRAQKNWSADKIWNIGLRLGSGDFGESNRQWALTWFEEAAAKDKDKLYNLYQVLSQGLMTPQNRDKAIEILKEAAAENQEEAIKEWDRVREQLRKEEENQVSEPPSASVPQKPEEISEVSRFIDSMNGKSVSEYNPGDCQKIAEIWRQEPESPELAAWLQDPEFGNRLLNAASQCLGKGDFRQAGSWIRLSSEIYRNDQESQLAEELNAFPPKSALTSPAAFAWEKSLKTRAVQNSWPHALVLAYLYRERYLQYAQEESVTTVEDEKEKNKKMAGMRQMKQNAKAACDKYRLLYEENKPASVRFPISALESGLIY